ncbi:hypothetical protein HMPREF1551_02300 [Capnocytophaga sp. oral taxon 863 str. F0517]|nr:hypothetical protein HMPREF1551_02300 [Capnocytophaga sp. oral taxon 863 str. F0517]
MSYYLLEAAHKGSFLLTINYLGIKLFLVKKYWKIFVLYRK